MSASQTNYLETNDKSYSHLKNRHIIQTGSANSSGNFTFSPEEANWLIIDDGTYDIINLVQPNSSLQVEYNEIIIAPDRNTIVTLRNLGNMQFIDGAVLVTLDGGKYEVAILRWNKSISKYEQKVQTLGTYADTYANIVTLITQKRIMKDREYFIMDRGDKGIQLAGVPTTDPNANTLSRYGTRIMQVPLTYAIGTFGGLNWKGVWQTLNTYVTGDLAIWGGLVWRNNAGVTGSPINDFQLDSNWTVQLKSANNSTSFYDEQEFKISYALKSDWIEKQWDNKGNVMGIDAQEQGLHYHFLVNPVDATDWNIETSNVVFANNSAIGIWNNFVQTYYYSTSSLYLGAIENNHIPGIITGNITAGYYGASMTGNTNNGSIMYNTTASIYDNSNNGTIEYNDVVIAIYDNSNDGRIGFNDKSISFIYLNSNGGSIDSNHCGDILQNSNNNNIIGNNCGSISQNSNNGNIDFNLSNVFYISSNQNNGNITSINVIGYVLRNQNNGDINSATSVVNVNIFNNINNGVIGPGVYIVDITDPVVNK